MGRKIILFVALLLFAVINAQLPPWESAVTNYVETLGKEMVILQTLTGSARISAWLLTALLICSIALSATALVWAVGVIVASDRIKALAKAEFAQAIASLLLVGLFFVYDSGSVRFVDAIKNATELLIVRAGLGEAEATGARIWGGPYTIAYLFLKAMAECAEKEFMKNYQISVGWQIAGNTRLEVSTTTFILELGSIIALPAWWNVFDYEYLASEFAWLAFLIYLQLNLLRYVESVAFIVFFPVGLALRAFPPTRGAGAVLIAISIGLYFVYPTVYALLVLGMPERIGECAQKPRVTITPQQMKCPLETAAPVEAAAVLATPPTPDIERARAETLVIANDLRYAAIGFFVISLGATFIFIRSISGILGADISEIGRSMMRML